MAVAAATTTVAAETDVSQKTWVAVHDFTISPDLSKKGISGWSIAEEMENKLTQSGKYRMITRAKIAKVLKEKNIDTGGSLSPVEMGKVSQAEYIVTGELKKQGDRLVMVAKLLDVSKHTGELVKSFDTWMYDDQGEKINEPVTFMIAALAEKLTMTPGEFLEYGMGRIKAKDYESAFEAFREMQRVTPFDQIKIVMTDIRKNPPPDSQLEIPANEQDAGKLFDRALELMAKGENGLAAKMLYGIQKNQYVGELIKLVEFADQARLCRTLATIDCAVPIEYSMEDLAVSPPDSRRLGELFREYGFTTLMKDLTSSPTLSCEQYRVVLTEEELRGVVADQAAMARA